MLAVQAKLWTNSKRHYEYTYPGADFQTKPTVVILNAARLWTEFSSDQKQRLQKVLFPEGVTFASGEFGTAATCPFFKLLEQPEGEKSRFAIHRGSKSRQRYRLGEDRGWSGDRADDAVE